MRIFYCTVALVLAAGLAAAQTKAPTSESFTVFIKGTPAGSEDVTVAQTADGMTISGTARIGPPLNLTVRRAEITYAPDGTPMSCTIEGSIRDQLLGLRTVVNGTSATSDATQGTQTIHKTDQVTSGALLLPNVFFGAYEALARRLTTATAGNELRAYIPPQSEIAIKVGPVTEETVRTPSRAVKIRRFPIQLMNPGQPLDGEIWLEPSGALVRFLLPAQSLDYARNDIVSVASRREPVSHPGDEQVRFQANGFVLAGTLSKPAGTIAKGTRLPAIVLVAGGSNTDRDDTAGGVPIFGQLASGLADAGFLVVRYDKRGVGQSGGRN